MDKVISLEPSSPGASLSFPRPELVWGQPCFMNTLRGEGRAEYRMLWPAAHRTHLATRGTHAFHLHHSPLTSHQSLQAHSPCLHMLNAFLKAPVGALTLHWTCYETLEDSLVLSGYQFSFPFEK